MNTLITRLSERRVVTVLIAGTYYAIGVLCHRRVSDLFDALRNTLSFKRYDTLMFDSGLFLMAVLFASCLVKIMHGREARTLKLLYLLFTGCLLAAAHHALIVFNIENIHFPQYAVLAVLVFALVGRFGETVFWVTLLGALDESYQYFVLYGNNNTVYLDFNDIILNLVGAGLGLVLVYALSDPLPAPVARGTGPPKRFFSSPAASAVVVLLLGYLLIAASGSLPFSREADASVGQIALSRRPLPRSFWLEPKIGKKFHILHPPGAMLIASFLISLYTTMDCRNPGSRNTP